MGSTIQRILAFYIRAFFGTNSLRVIPLSSEEPKFKSNVNVIFPAVYLDDSTIVIEENKVVEEKND